MATITAPSTPSAPFYLGKGFGDANGVNINIFGHYLPNNLPTELAGLKLAAPWHIFEPTTLFDVSTLPINSEVVTLLYVSQVSISSAITFTVNWYRTRDNLLITSFTRSYPHPGEGMAYLPGLSFAGWIGWLSENVAVGSYPLYREIQENGLYHITVTASGGQNFTQTINFAVKGVPPELVLGNRTTYGGFKWTVRLSDYFDTSNYIRVGVCTQPFTQGQSHEPSGIVAYNYAPSSTIACVSEGTVSELSTPSPTLYGFAQSSNGLYYQAGSASLINNFAWTTPKVQGGDFNLSAAEWNEFTGRINAFRTFKGLGTYDFTPAVAGNKFEYFYFNQARYCINELNPTLPLPASVGPGANLYASQMNGLVSSLNSVT